MLNRGVAQIRSNSYEKWILNRVERVDVFYPFPILESWKWLFGVKKSSGRFGDTAFRFFFGNYVDLDKAYIQFYYYYYERTSTWRIVMIYIQVHFFYKKEDL